MPLDITDPKAWKGGWSGKKRKGKKSPRSGRGGEGSALATVHKHGMDLYTGVGGKRAAKMRSKRLF